MMDTLFHVLAVPGGGAGCLAAERDRQIRLHSVHTDLMLDLPPSIALPDGEEIPYGASKRLHIRDSEQESEIYQKCIRAPPNRTVFEGESLPPYRASNLSSSQDCLSHIHNTSRTTGATQVPPVSVPRSRQRLSALTMVPCLADTKGTGQPTNHHTHHHHHHHHTHHHHHHHHHRDQLPTTTTPTS